MTENNDERLRLLWVIWSAVPVRSVPCGLERFGSIHNGSYSGLIVVFSRRRSVAVS